MSVLLLSGGLDSAVLLAWEIDAGRRPICVGFDYGQRHRVELLHARIVADHYGCLFRRMPMPAFPPSALTDPSVPVPHAHYADPAQATTIVPGRNLAMLVAAADVATASGREKVLIAAHAGDAAIYPDCRPEFVASSDAALRSSHGVSVEAPFLEMSKRDVVILGRSLRVPIALTWSCYEGGDYPCGECGACVERREALA